MGKQLKTGLQQERPKYAGMSPRKLRLYADLIRNRRADEALEILGFEITRSARLIEKVLKSAIGNAKFKQRLSSRIRTSLFFGSFK